MLLLPHYCSEFRVENGHFAPLAAPERTQGGWIMLGSIAMPAGGPPPATKINSCDYIDDDDDAGELRSHDNTIHLFNLQLSDAKVYRESDSVVPGDTLNLTPTSWERGETSYQKTTSSPTFGPQCDSQHHQHDDLSYKVWRLSEQNPLW